jgi:hypothetical protein
MNGTRRYDAIVQHITGLHITIERAFACVIGVIGVRNKTAFDVKPPIFGAFAYEVNSEIGHVHYLRLG